MLNFSERQEGPVINLSGVGLVAGRIYLALEVRGAIPTPPFDLSLKLGKIWYFQCPNIKRKTLIIALFNRNMNHSQASLSLSQCIRHGYILN